MVGVKRVWRWFYFVGVRMAVFGGCALDQIDRPRSHVAEKQAEGVLPTSLPRIQMSRNQDEIASRRLKTLWRLLMGRRKADIDVE